MEIRDMKADIVCITETWLKTNSIKSAFQIEGYSSYFNSRSSITGGGVVLYTKYAGVQLTSEVTTNDAYNICAISIGNGANKLLAVAVYRAPWASCDDTESMCDELDRLIIQFDNAVIVGDFNLPKLSWSDTNTTQLHGAENVFSNIVLELNLTQVANQATRDNALLDLLLVS